MWCVLLSPVMFLVLGNTDCVCDRCCFWEVISRLLFRSQVSFHLLRAACPISFCCAAVLSCPVVVLPCSVLSCLCASQVVCDLTGGWNLRSFLSLLPSFLCFGSPLLCVDFSCCGRQGLLSRCGAQLLLVAVASLSAEHEL